MPTTFIAYPQSQFTVVVRICELEAVSDRRARRPAAQGHRGQHGDEAGKGPQTTRSGGPHGSSARGHGAHSLSMSPERIARFPDCDRWASRWRLEISFW